MYYPNPQQTPENTFTTEALDRALTALFGWRQGAGQFGNLTLHACWGESSVLRRKYHGQYSSMGASLMAIACTLYERTGEYRWKRLATEVVHNLMYLQDDCGGFIHAAAEFEPVYNSSQTCPIHQFMPVHALLHYSEQPYADPELKQEIRAVIDRHWTWFQRTHWQRGNGAHHPIDWPGWCAVTNQDLVVVAALARYGRVFGDLSRFEQCGRQVLDSYLSPRYYYRDLGLFERGDSKDWAFPERSNYYPIILDMLERIYAVTRDDRIPEVVDSVCRQLLKAAYVESDGLTYICWGMGLRREGGRARIAHRIRYPVSFGAILNCIHPLSTYLDRHPDSGGRAVVDSLRTTVARYVNGYGSTPLALNPHDGIFTIATGGLIPFLLRELGGRVKTVRTDLDLPCVRREYGDMAFVEDLRHYEILHKGERMFAGLKREPKGIVVGNGETLSGVSFESLKQVDVVETIRFEFDPETALDP